jgi:trans-aconitate 2-methyltransferase
VLARWRDSLAPGGQLAVQVPANADHPSHRVARELAAEWLGADAPPDAVERNVLRPEEYARVLLRLGCEYPVVRLQVYCHKFSSSADVVEWVRGTTLTRLSPVLRDDDFERFVVEYRRRLVAELGPSSPYWYTFKRILMAGRLPGD